MASTVSAPGESMDDRWRHADMASAAATGNAVAVGADNVTRRAVAESALRDHLERGRKVVTRNIWRARAATKPAPIVRRIDAPDGGWLEVCEEPAHIEPEAGYVITDRGVLLEDSLMPNFDYFKATWRLGVPRLRYAARKRAIHFDTVISLRHRWEWNYYHFLVDVLGKLETIDNLGDQAGIDMATPLVVGRYVHQLPFAERFLQRMERRVVTPGPQDEIVVGAERVVYARTRAPMAARVGHLLGLLQAPAPDPTSDDRIYLTRPPVGRRAINESEVRGVLARHGFHPLDTSAMSVDEQIETFARARHIVALHGAGMTNIIFRAGAPLSVLELHGRAYSGLGEFARISAELGYTYDSLACESGPGKPQRAAYHVDPIELEAAVRIMLSDAANPVAETKMRDDTTGDD